MSGESHHGCSMWTVHPPTLTDFAVTGALRCTSQRMQHAHPRDHGMQGCVQRAHVKLRPCYRERREGSLRLSLHIRPPSTLRLCCNTLSTCTSQVTPGTTPSCCLCLCAHLGLTPQSASRTAKAWTETPADTCWQPMRGPLPPHLGSRYLKASHERATATSPRQQIPGGNP